MHADPRIDAMRFHVLAGTFRAGIVDDVDALDERRHLCDHIKHGVAHAIARDHDGDMGSHRCCRRCSRRHRRPAGGVGPARQEDIGRRRHAQLALA
jgi:hypothetical protein